MIILMMIKDSRIKNEAARVDVSLYYVILYYNMLYYLIHILIVYGMIHHVAAARMLPARVCALVRFFAAREGGAVASHSRSLQH